MADRYVRPGPPGALPVSVTAGTVSGGRVVVTSTARAGSTVVILAGQPKASRDTTVVVSATAGADGHFRATVPLRSGANVITAVAARGTHATGWAQVTVKVGRLVAALVLRPRAVPGSPSGSWQDPLTTSK